MQLSLLLMAVTILSKIFGLLREISLSYFYGTGYVADAFLIAFFIPSLMLNVITTGISTGFIPIYSSILNKRGREQADDFTTNLAGIIFFISLITAILGIIFSEQLVGILAYGFDSEIMDETVLYTRLIMVSLPISAVAGIYRGYLQLQGHFVVTVIHTIIMNVVIILFIGLSKISSPFLLGVGAALGMILQYSIFIPPLLQSGYKFKFNLNLGDRHVNEMKNLTMPILISAAAYEINLMVDKMIASSLGEGAVSALNYSGNLQDFVVGVVVMSIVTVQFPKMSRLAVTSDYKNLKKNFTQTINAMMLLIIPATAGLMIFAKPIVTLLFFRGEFDAASLEITSRALFYYALGIVGISFNTVIQRMFYSLKKPMEPVIISIVIVTVNIILNIILSKLFGVIGLPLATSISVVVGSIVSLWRLDVLVNGMNYSENIKYIVICGFNTIIMGITSYFVYNFGRNNLFLLLGILVALLVYLGLSSATKQIDLKRVGKEISKHF